MPDQTVDMDQDFAPGWRPEEGDKIVGVVTDLSRGWSDQSESFYPIVTVNDEEKGPIAIHCFHHILNKKMNEWKPTVGERIGVKYKEKRPTKDGKRTVQVYEVKVQGRSIDIWDNTPQTKPAPQTDSPATEDEDDIPF